MDRNSREEIQADIDHLDGMLENVEKLSTNSKADKSTIDYLRMQIVDWKDELIKLL